MGNRKTILATGQIYHIFNRGIDKRKIFIDNYDFRRLYDSLRYYQSPRHQSFSIVKPKNREELILRSKDNHLLEIISYCLMPNHFHILAKQSSENGISDYLQIVTNSYARYFNARHQRIGGLFQGNFKAVRIEDADQLLHVNRYIHLNPIVGYLTKDLLSWRWSSLREYVLEDIKGICHRSLILDQFKSRADYLMFVKDYIDFKNTIDITEGLLFDNDDKYELDVPNTDV